MPNLPSTPGTCVVCGEETYNRCSDCLKHGLDWMYFCTIEHKKLVWFTHKRVCGIRANPFCWPGFSVTERGELYNLRNEPYETVDGTMSTLSDEENPVHQALCKAGDGGYKGLGLPANEARVVFMIDALQDGQRRILPEWLHGEWSTRTLLTARSEFCRVRFSNRSVLEAYRRDCNLDNRPVEEEVFDALAYRSMEYCPEFAMNQNRKYPLDVWSTFHHKYLLYYTIAALESTLSTSAPVPTEDPVESAAAAASLVQLDDFLNHTKRELNRFLLRVLGRQFPAEAKSLLHLSALGSVSNETRLTRQTRYR